MTDEERKKLITELREDAPDWTTSGQRVRMICDEVERLVEEQDQLFEQLIIRSETGMAKDMQTLMQISNAKTDEIERLAAELQAMRNINGELNHQIHLWKCGSQFSGSSPNPPGVEAGWGCVKSGSPGEWVSLEENERLRKELAAAEAALRNTLLHYNVSDVHFLDSEEKME